MTHARNGHRAREAQAADTAIKPPLTADDIKTLTRKLVRDAHPRLIILFGSRAYGKPRRDSDLDVLVVADDARENAAYGLQLSRQVGTFPVKLDVHGRTPEELTRRLAMGDEFMQEIVGRGQQLYPSASRNGFSGQVRRALQQGITEPMDNGEVVHEWVEKAEGDFMTAEVIARQRKKFSAFSLCWSCEQCVEKYLKAFLTRHRVNFKREHKLDNLLEQCIEVDQDFRMLQSYLDAVGVCTPRTRYPGNDVSEAQARAAFAACKPVRKFVRAKLGITGAK